MHDYMPSAIHMGDCNICGHMQNAGAHFMPSERVLPDDYPIYGDYFYLADGKVYRSDWHGIAVAELKKREKFKEVRSCDWRRYNGTNKQIEDLAQR
jgi:hypothetical protein